MSEFKLEIKGLEKLDAWLERFPVEIHRGMQAAMQGALEFLRGVVAKYPPATQANRPPGMDGYSWYERGFGVKTVTGKSYPVSEMLGRSWTAEVKGLATSVKGLLGTKVSYAPFVQDMERQAWFHARRGWVPVQLALQGNAKRIQAFFEDMIEEILRRIGG